MTFSDKVEAELALQRQVFGKPSDQASRMASWLWNWRIAEWERYHYGSMVPGGRRYIADGIRERRIVAHWLEREGLKPLDYNNLVEARVSSKWLWDHNLRLDPDDVLNFYELGEVIDLSKLAATAN